MDSSILQSEYLCLAGDGNSAGYNKVLNLKMKMNDIQKYFSTNMILVARKCQDVPHFLQFFIALSLALMQEN